MSPSNDNLLDAGRLQWTPRDHSSSSLLGEGAFGSVYRGSFDGADVAIKVIKPRTIHGRGQMSATQQHYREIHRLEALQHPLIVQYLGVSKDPSSSETLIVTELVGGGSLHDALTVMRNEGSPEYCGAILDEGSFLQIASCIASGLLYVQNEGFTHGDMKPHNVLLTSVVTVNGDRASFPSDVKAKIADFGLSKRLQQSDDIASTMNTADFGTGPVGTFAYMAPEVFEGVANLSPETLKAADIYAFGIVMYELLSGRQPWVAERVRSAWALHDIVVKQRRRPGWGPRKPSIPKEYIEFVERCWAHEPSDRPTAPKAVDQLIMWKKEFREKVASAASSESGSKTGDGYHKTATPSPPLNGSQEKLSDSEGQGDSQSDDSDAPEGGTPSRIDSEFDGIARVVTRPINDADVAKARRRRVSGGVYFDSGKDEQDRKMDSLSFSNGDGQGYVERVVSQHNLDVEDERKKLEMQRQREHRYGTDIGASSESEGEDGLEDEKEPLDSDIREPEEYEPSSKPSRQENVVGPAPESSEYSSNIICYSAIADGMVLRVETERLLPPDNPSLDLSSFKMMQPSGAGDGGDVGHFMGLLNVDQAQGFLGGANVDQNANKLFMDSSSGVEAQEFAPARSSPQDGLERKTPSPPKQDEALVKDTGLPQMELSLPASSPKRQGSMPPRDEKGNVLALGDNFLEIGSKNEDTAIDKFFTAGRRQRQEHQQSSNLSNEDSMISGDEVESPRDIDAEDVERLKRQASDQAAESSDSSRLPATRISGSSRSSFEREASDSPSLKQNTSILSVPKLSLQSLKPSTPLKNNNVGATGAEPLRKKEGGLLGSSVPKRAHSMAVSPEVMQPGQEQPAVADASAKYSSTPDMPQNVGVGAAGVSGTAASSGGLSSIHPPSAANSYLAAKVGSGAQEPVVSHAAGTGVVRPLMAPRPFTPQNPQIPRIFPGYPPSAGSAGASHANIPTQPYSLYSVASGVTGNTTDYSTSRWGKGNTSAGISQSTVTSSDGRSSTPSGAHVHLQNSSAQRPGVNVSGTSVGAQSHTPYVSNPAILEAIRGDSARVVLDSLWRLGNGAAIAATLAKFPNFGGSMCLNARECLEVVLGLIERNRSSAAPSSTIAKDLCVAVGRIAVNHNNTISARDVNKALPVTLSAMQANHSEGFVFSACCYALCNLFRICNVIEDEKVRNEIAMWIIYAMSWNVNHRGAKLYTLASTSFAAARTFMFLNEANTFAFLNGGVSINAAPLVKAFEAARFFDTHEVIVQSGVTVLASVFFYPSTRSLAMKTFGVELLNACLSHNAQRFAIAHIALSTFEVLLSDPKDISQKDMIIARVTTVLQTIVGATRTAAKENTPSAESLQALQAGLSAIIAACTFDERLKIAAVDAGAARTIIDSLHALTGRHATRIVSELRNLIAEKTCVAITIIAAVPIAGKQLRDAQTHRLINHVRTLFAGNDRITNAAARAAAAVAVAP